MTLTFKTTRAVCGLLFGAIIVLMQLGEFGWAFTAAVFGFINLAVASLFIAFIVPKMRR